MNKNGSGDQLTSIVNFEYFLAFNTHGLFYVAQSSKEESFEKVMVYDAATQTATPIKTHVDNTTGNNVVTLGSRIYMIDDMNHSHIMCYDMSAKTTTDIKGIPSKFKDPSTENILFVEKVKVYVSYSGLGDEGSELYLITGNKAKACESSSPDDSSVDHKSYYETGDGGKFSYDHQTDILAFWTGSEYQDLELPDISEQIVSGKKLYVLSYERKDNWPSDDWDGEPLPTVVTGSPYTLYSVSSDGSVEALFEGVDMVPHDSDLPDGFSCDMMGGWFFAFWYNDGYGQIEGLFLKHKVESPPLQ